jgi:hypothetical protein
MFEKKQCLRDAQIWASPFWNRPNVYEIIGTCMLVSFGTKIMLAGAQNMELRILRQKLCLPDS